MPKIAVDSNWYEKNVMEPIIKSVTSSQFIVGELKPLKLTEAIFPFLGRLSTGDNLELKTNLLWDLLSPLYKKS